MRPLPVVVVVVVAIFAAAVHAQDPVPEEMTPEQRFKRGKGLFDYSDCPGARDMLTPLAVPGQLQDEREQLDVHRMLGVCDALENKISEAKLEFSSLLSIDPRFNLDPFLTPPAAIEIFERQKEAMKAQLEELQRAREKAKAASDEEKGGVLLERTTVVREEPLPVAFMPFGLAQAANGETVKAVIVGVAQGVTLATTVVGFWGSMALLHGASDKGTPADKASQANAYNGFLYTELGAGMAFVLAYGYGATDALWNREDQAIVEKREQKRPLTPDEIQALKKIPAHPAETPH